MRWFQFSARSLLLAFVAVSLLITWYVDRRGLEKRIASLEARFNPAPTYSGNAWSAAQATGPPDTERAGDCPTAWASATPDGQAEWIELTYPKAVSARAIEIHESYNPGAITKVSLFDQDGNEVVVWMGTAPTPTSGPNSVSRIPVSVDFKVERVKVYLNSPAVRGWNEIDAVGIQYSWGRTLWAEKATASSSFANGGIY